MKRIQHCRLFLLLMALVTLPGMSVAQKTFESNGVKILYNELENGTFEVIEIFNDSGKTIIPKVDNCQLPDLSFGRLKTGDKHPIGRIAKESFGFDFPQRTGDYFRIPQKQKVESASEKTHEPRPEKRTAEPAAEQSEEKKEEKKPEKKKSEKEKKSDSEEVPPTTDIPEVEQPAAEPSAADMDEIIGKQDAFFKQDSVDAFVVKTDTYAELLEKSSNKRQTIAENALDSYVKEALEEIEVKEQLISSIALEIAESSRPKVKYPAKRLEEIAAVMKSRIDDRREACTRLAELIDSADTEVKHGLWRKEKMVNFGIVGAIVSILFVWSLVVLYRKKKKTASRPHATKAAATPSSEDANSAIVVRRRTTSILKKQNIDDVIDSPDYLKIDACEFAQDSAVRRIFIKNTCIKEIYNLYAEDLRDANSPKEDGCMVLGRWVRDEAGRTYDVSLEEVVFPGEDAVFKEYELNFGGKIKLRIAERLRKLRRETDLQYDLTCWVHSHPGLGVFFSNSDNNVQMQLKHPQHPNFLVAFVIDILTSNQETGIFTFRSDGSINSKNDLLKMYSLEQMYKWAVESSRKSYIPENHFNVLGNAKVRDTSCAGIELNNSAIIDLAQMTVDSEASSIVGWTSGFATESAAGQEYVVTGIVPGEGAPASGMTGCLVSVPHPSLPTIQRLIGTKSRELRFILVYSSRFLTLTAIPVLNGEIITDESFYGTVTVEDLKIWTRRKR